MSNKHEPEIPVALEAFVGRLDTLKSVFGANAEPILAAVKQAILQAMAARDRGDQALAFRHLSDAMERLARFADSLDSNEAMMMRAVAQMFQAALARQDEAEAKRTAGLMFDKSGARMRKPE